MAIKYNGTIIGETNRSITDSYTGTSSTTDFSQKGANDLYTGITNGTIKAAKATTADSATYVTKATQDGSGNNIVNTYQKKPSFSEYYIADLDSSYNKVDQAADANVNTTLKMVLGNNRFYTRGIPISKGYHIISVTLITDLGGSTSPESNTMKFFIYSATGVNPYQTVSLKDQLSYGTGHISVHNCFNYTTILNLSSNSIICLVINPSVSLSAVVETSHLEILSFT